MESAGRMSEKAGRDMAGVAPIGRAIIVPGARKAGTTSLYVALARHPEVRAGRFKEPQFFALDEETVSEHLSWYLDGFGSPAQRDSMALLDASTFYLMSSRAPAQIARYVADPRIVILLRDPAERAFAGYEYLRQRIPVPDRRGFQEIVEALEDAVPGSSLEEAEARVLAAAVRSGDIPEEYYGPSFHRDNFGAPFDTRLEDPQNIFRYFTESSYSSHVNRWLQTFPGCVLLVAFERLVARPAEMLEEIQAFCGLDRDERLRELPRENPTRVPRSGAARWILDRVAARTPGSWVDGAVRLAHGLGAGDAVRQRILRGARGELSPDLRDRCRALLGTEYAWWREHHPDLAAWWSEILR